MTNYNLLQNAIINICDNEFKFFFNKANVVGVGMGYKMQKGMYILKNCITVLVSKKVPAIELSKENLIPSTYKGIMTDVIESGNMTFNSLRSKIRPAIGGYSIGTTLTDNIGTLGCLVKDRNSTIHLLSSNHVLALINAAPIGTEIVQPSLNDNGNPVTDVIARLSRYIPLMPITPTSRPTNLADCAIAQLVNTTIASPAIAYVGIPKGIKIPLLLEQVTKIGRTTERTFGLILLVNTTIELFDEAGNAYLMQKQIITSKMSEAGDSGALLLSKDNFALGLLSGSSPSLSFYNLIDLVLNLLNVFLITE